MFNFLQNKRNFQDAWQVIIWHWIPKCHTIFLCCTTHNLSEGLETHYIQHSTIFHRGWYLKIDLIQSQKTTLSCWAKCGWYSTIFFFSISFLKEFGKEGIENVYSTFYFDVLYGRRSWIRTKILEDKHYKYSYQIGISNKFICISYRSQEEA